MPVHSYTNCHCTQLTLSQLSQLKTYFSIFTFSREELYFQLRHLRHILFFLLIFFLFLKGKRNKKIIRRIRRIRTIELIILFCTFRCNMTEVKIEVAGKPPDPADIFCRCPVCEETYKLGKGKRGPLFIGNYGRKEVNGREDCERQDQTVPGIYQLLQDAFYPVVDPRNRNTGHRLHNQSHISLCMAVPVAGVSGEGCGRKVKELLSE